MSTKTSPWEHVATARAGLNQLLPETQSKPRVGIVLGSGLGPLADEIQEPTVIPYERIPSMPRTHVEGHAGNFIFGKLANVDVVCLAGRAHLYEGHCVEDVVFGVRLMASLGVDLCVLTNAAGGITEDCSPGTLMLISDHLNLTGKNPLIGENDERWGPRFVDLSVAYDATARRMARDAAKALGVRMTEGTYAGLLGPTYETPAEIRMLEVMGANAVGMSTVLETIALRHQGVSVLGISCITNHAAGKSGELLSHEEVGHTALQASRDFCTLVTEVVRRWPLG